MTSDRRRELLRVLREGHASTQQEIAEALRAAGHEVTQATVSRDLRAVGAMKLMIDGRLVYRLPDDAKRAPGGDLMTRNLERSLAEFAIDIRQAHSLIVVLTEPGHAAAVARAIDLAGLDEAVGTVAGDDTIFVATPSPDEAAALLERWTEKVAPVEAARNNAN